MAFDLVDIKFPTGAWGKIFAKVGNFTLQKTDSKSTAKVDISKLLNMVCHYIFRH